MLDNVLICAFEIMITLFTVSKIMLHFLLLVIYMRKNSIDAEFAEMTWI